MQAHSPRDALGLKRLEVGLQDETPWQSTVGTQLMSMHIGQRWHELPTTALCCVRGAPEHPAAHIGRPARMQRAGMRIARPPARTHPVGEAGKEVVFPPLGQLLRAAMMREHDRRDAPEAGTANAIGALEPLGGDVQAHAVTQCWHTG